MCMLFIVPKQPQKPQAKTEEDSVMNLRDSKIYNLIQLEKDLEQYEKDMLDYPYELEDYQNGLIILVLSMNIMVKANQEMIEDEDIQFGN